MEGRRDRAQGAEEEGLAVLTTSRWDGAGLTIGSVQVETPVVLAPMAGITNAAYRRLCRE